MTSDFKKLDEARKLLGLGEKATIGEIKDAYRKQAVKYHPDKCDLEDTQKSEEMFKKINQANETLMIYCANYEFPFSESEVQGTNMDKDNYEHMKRFYDGWWGDLEQ